MNVHKVPAEGETYFFSRNYKISLAESTFDVTPALLYITANDVTSKYGVEPKYSYTFGDRDGNYKLMFWDRPTDVIKSVGLEEGKKYVNYAPGSYKDAVVVTTQDNISNYVFAKDNITSTISSGKLTVKKGDLLVNASAQSKMYDGTSVELIITIEPVLSDAITKDLVQTCEESNVIYYQLKDDNTKIRLTKTPVNAGNYIAEIIVAEENDYYNKAETSVNFSIYKAHVDVDTPQVPDMEMKDGLQLSDQQLPDGWSWVKPDTKLSVGKVEGNAVYTPEDTINYYTEERTICFSVYEKGSTPDSGEPTEPGTTPDPDEPTEPGTTPDPDESTEPGKTPDSENPANSGTTAGMTDSTNPNGMDTSNASKDSGTTNGTKGVNSGDENYSLLWGILLIGMLGIIVVLCIKRRKK